MRQWIFCILAVLAASSLHAAETITPVQTTVPDVDTDGDGVVDPVETVKTTVTLTSNSSGTAATGVKLTETLQGMALAPGSVHISPLAINDSFNAVGNTKLYVGTTSGGEPAAVVAGNVLTNDVTLNPTGGTDTISLTAISNGATAQGGTVTLNANGTFTYTPAVGFSGADTFTYTIANSARAALTDTGTVTINVGAKVWYVNNTAGAGGTGASTSPFDALADVSGVTGPDGVGDIIYLFSGTGDYTGGIVLLDNQTLQGAGTALVVGGFTLASAGTDPVIANSGGNGVTVEQGNTLTGFTVGNCSGFDIANTATATVGTLTISNVDCTGTGGIFRADSGGALTVTIGTGSTTSAAGNGIELGGALTGSFTVTSGAISGVTGTDVLLNGGTETISIGSSITSSAGGSIDIGSHGTNNITLSGALNITGGTGISVHNNTSGTIAFTNASKVVNTSTSSAVNLSTNTGATINFTGGGLALTTSSGTGFSATGGGTVTVQGSNNTITTTSTGTALNLNGVTVGNGAANGVLFATVNTSGAATGITLASVLQGASSTGIDVQGGAIANATSRGVDIDTVQEDVSIAATISTTAAGRSVEVTNCGRTVAGGSIINFTGAITDPGLGINLDNNDQNTNGATITFSGGLNIDSTTNSGFNAINGGTVAVTGSNNTIDTTTGTALNVDSTNIGGSGLTFKSINTTTSTTNAGIVLIMTGSNGLSVTGDGSANSGGTISSRTGTTDGILLNAANNISLTDMNITTCGGSWIDATTVNGLTLTRVSCDLSTDHGIKASTLTNLVIVGGTFDQGGAAGPNGIFGASGNPSANFHGINITNLLGTSSVTGANFKRSNTIQFRVNNNTATNFAGAPDTLTVSNTQWNTHNGNTAGEVPFNGDHLSVNADTGTNFRLIVNSSAGQNVFKTGGTAVQATAGGTTGKMDAQVSGIQSGGNTGGATPTFNTDTNTACVVIGETGGGSITYDIHDNTSLGTGSLAIAVTHSSTTGGTSTGKIKNNNITHVAGASTNTIQVIVEGDSVGMTGGTGTVLIKDNTINGNFQRGIMVQARHGTPILNATIDNNTATGTDTTGSALQVFDAESGGSGSGQAATLRLNMLNNDVFFGVGAVYTAAYRLINRTGCTFQLQDFTGNGTLSADVQTWVTTTKVNTGTPVSATVGPGFTPSGGSIPTPP